MNANNQRTALVTGATSGLGLAAALQAAQAGYGRVIVTGRTSDRADAARDSLAEQFGRAVFESVTLDLNDTKSVGRAVAGLSAAGYKIEYLLLNAGLVSGNKPTITDEGVELTFAASLIGHHQLTMGVLDAGLLTDEARIVIAGSEAARGDVPTFNPTDLRAYAKKHFDGDLAKAAEALIRNTGPNKFKPATAYADAKVFVAWWAAALARRLPDGMTVNAVSPGSAPGTDAGRNANFFMKRIMMPVFKLAPKRLGMAADVPVAASRYLEASDYGPKVNGEFFASAAKKMTGPLHKMDLGHIADGDSQEAAWTATVQVAGVGFPASVSNR